MWFGMLLISSTSCEFVDLGFDPYHCIVAKSTNQEYITATFIPIAIHPVHIIVSTNFRFQRTIYNLFGPSHLNAINAFVNPFILPLIKYNIIFDIYIFVFFKA